MSACFPGWTFMPPNLTLVAAMARNRVIGRDGDMPWRLPADLAHFKRVTLGHPVIMGRKTFESIGRPLPGRLNIVISRGQPELPETVVLADGLESALAACQGSDEVMVIGGGEIYRQALPLARRLVTTLIDADIEGDTVFPAFDGPAWRLVASRSRPADERNAYAMVFADFERSADASLEKSAPGTAGS